MVGFIALDVVISLVLTYLLYSLLTAEVSHMRISCASCFSVATLYTVVAVFRHTGLKFQSVLMHQQISTGFHIRPRSAGIYALASVYPNSNAQSNAVHRFQVARNRSEKSNQTIKKTWIWISSN